MKLLSDNDDALISLIGAVIRQAIRDCFSDCPEIKKDARDFIFSNRICIFLDKYGMARMINVNFIRKIILEGKKDYFIRYLLYNKAHQNKEEENETVGAVRPR
jgi:hypothetical protein